MCLGLDVMVLKLRDCGPGAEVLSVHPHICADDSGRVGAAIRITWPGCISSSVREKKKKSIDDLERMEQWWVGVSLGMRSRIAKNSKNSRQKKKKFAEIL